MKKAVWKVESVQQDTYVKIENVVSASFSNYSAKPVSFEINGVVRELPEYTTGVPIAFKIDLSGHLFDINTKFKFQSGFKNVVIDYAQIKDC